MRRFLINLIACALVSMPVAVFGATAQRVALVIGNGSYMNAPLRNPVNDATDMASTLKHLGFSVTLKTDANQRGMKEAIRSFGRRLQKGGVGLFYYAGHGIQYRGRNYLMPVHAEVRSAADVEYEAVDAGRVLAQMEAAGNDLNIIILDACRDNPYASSFRSGSRGLAKMDAPTGSILAYSTAPGSVAADGDGRNGLYTQYLLKHMTTSNTKIEDTFKQVRIEVLRASNNTQTPWESSSLTGDFYFRNANTKAYQPTRAIGVKKRPGVQNLDGEEEMWAIVKNSAEVDDFYMFIDEYPGSRFLGAAKLRIRQLRREQKSLTVERSERGWLAVGIQNVNKDLAAFYDYPYEKGVLVSKVFKGGSAEKAGIKAADIIMSVNGKKLETTKQLASEFITIKSGDYAFLKVFRKGKVEAINVKMFPRVAETQTRTKEKGRVWEHFFGKDKKNADTQKAEDPFKDFFPGSETGLGFGVIDLTNEDKNRLGFSEKRSGALVSNINLGGTGAKAGIQIHDLIVEVNHKKVNNAEDFIRKISKLENNETFSVLIKRPKKGYVVFKLNK